MKTVDVLIQAKKNIVKYGWVQGYMGFKEVGFCSLGALDSACENNERAEAYLQAAAGRDIVGFNDDPLRTKEHVLAVFDQAIKNAKRRHINGD